MTLNREGLPTILLVDDDVDICRNLTDILTDLGYQVDMAHEGLSALELVRRKAYDVALLDLRMPGMDGLELYREIRKVRAGTVAILITAYADEATTAEALAAGTWQVMAKPVDFAALMRKVDEAMAQPLVLVVDDDRELCANLWEILRERGYRVSLAHDEHEAAERLKDASYRVVLIDMKIPHGDGRRVFQQVREADPDARTIIITGYRAEFDDLVGKVVNEGADAVCYKPFDIAQLLTTLERLAASRGQTSGDSPDAG
jgi:two-component system, NtrC family, response regulator HydG